MSYVERLKKLQLESLETRRLRNDLQDFIWFYLGLHRLTGAPCFLLIRLL